MLQLYTYYRSISTHRVRIALNHKGVNYDSRYIDQDRGQHQDEKYLRLNPQGLVPALVLEDETVVTQSFAILESGGALPGATAAAEQSRAARACAQLRADRGGGFHAVDHHACLSLHARQHGARLRPAPWLV